MTHATDEVSGLLAAWRDGDQTALDRLLPLVYGELRRLAHRYMKRERPGHTLQTTALVNEAYLRLCAGRKGSFQDRAHFFGVAAQVMRHLLVDHARSRDVVKRGGGARQVTLDEDVAEPSVPGDDVLALDEALTRLTAIDPRKGRLVELRYFGGLSVEETAEVLAVSTITVKREWLKAKAWLYRELTGARHDA